MKKEVAEKFVSALRSGEYKQSVGALKRVSAGGSCSYCALGVLIDLFHKETGEGKWYQGATGSTVHAFTGSDNFRKTFGVGGPTMTRLMLMNDKEGKTFAEIADWVEREFLAS